ncbi:MAG: RNA 2',3'-cyclic phosphodiesterase [Acholeplasmataceae bacterium]|nr:RNA 2',3'-cyclic phosphodiesterase [Acholeplasmataceae bacterium]
MRIFVGIKVPKEIGILLEEEADKILKHTKSYKKNLNQNYHLTIKFIGEMKISDIVALDQLLAKSLKEVKAFDVHLKDMGYFEKNEDYTLWIGAHQGVGYLKEIYQIVDKKSREFFGIDHTDFVPHVTLAKHVKVDKVKVLNKNKTKNYTFKVEEISIYYSHRAEGVLTYTPLSKIKLV